MKPKYLIPVLALMMIVPFSCTKPLEEPDLAALTKSEISGERLWQRISEDSDYHQYRQWPDHQGMQPGQAPHGVLHEVFVNKNIYDALPVDEEVPYGSILVKENYNASRELDKFTVMAKVEGYSPEHNDWFWAAIAPDGTILAEGEPQGCLNCHTGMAENDYIIIKNVNEAP